ncbi:hypothetical protein SRHO_G00190740 [Serrasalmus rhombeus]
MCNSLMKKTIQQADERNAVFIFFTQHSDVGLHFKRSYKQVQPFFRVSGCGGERKECRTGFSEHSAQRIAMLGNKRTEIAPKKQK